MPNINQRVDVTAGLEMFPRHWHVDATQEATVRKVKHLIMNRHSSN